MDKLKRTLTCNRINYDMIKEEGDKDTVYDEEDLDFIIDILLFD